jgi:hypothetical protein
VFNPRPETEVLVEAVLEPVPGLRPDTLSKPSPSVIDVGTGSGAIAVTLALERPAWQVMAVDRSSTALAFARRNAAAHGAPVRFLRGDLLENFPAGSMDGIAANLPYLDPATSAAWPKELFWDGGDIVDAEGVKLLEGFAGAVAACAGGLLVGPGASAWDVTGRDRRGPVAAEVVYATDGTRVVSVDDTTFGFSGDTRHAHELVNGDDSVATARIDGNELLITTMDGEMGRFSLEDGRRIKRGRAKKATPALPAGVKVGSPEEGSRVTIGERSWPLPADGAVAVEGGWWLWTNEGMLVQLGG